VPKLRLVPSRLAVLPALVGVAMLVAATGIAHAADLEDGDFVVGVAVPPTFPFENRGGKIVRIRAGVSTDFCSSSPTPHTNGFFQTPHNVVLDGQGRVVLLAQLGDSEVGAGDGLGLWRCDSLGAAPTMLGAFGGGSALGYPQPFGSGPVGHADGLHMKRVKGLDLNTGTASSSDLYVFAINRACGAGPFETVGYNPVTGQWTDSLEGPVPSAASQCPNGYQMDMINAGGYTFSVGSTGIRGVLEPIRLDFQIGEFSGGLVLQKTTDLINGAPLPVFFDETNVANIVECEASDGVPLGTPYNAGGSINGLSGLSQIAWRDGGLVLQAGGGYPQAPNITNLALFNLIPGDDVSSMAHWGLAGCMQVKTIQFTPWHGFNDHFDPSGDARDVRQMDPGGRFGTQYGRVIGLGPGVDVDVYATGLMNARGIDVYPPFVPTTSGVSVFFKIESPINVLITAADGRRIGADLDTGAPINDFGAAGYDSQTAEPHIYGVRDPLAGNFTIQTKGTGDGPYAITTYGVNLGTDVISQAQFTGYTALGDESAHQFDLDEAGQVSTAAGRVPDGDGLPGTPLTVTPAAGSDLTLTWGASCTAGDSDYAIYEGALGSFTSHTAVLCSTWGATTATFTPTAGNRYYLVVPNNGLREGSYGVHSSGAQRPAGLAACLLQSHIGCP